MEKFRNLGISEAVLEALEKKGFEEPTPIQELAIPLLLKGETDIVGQAQTGTGKTAAFGIPIIEKIKDKSKNVQAIILAPTRELAIQVADEMNGLKGSRRLSIMPIYGGQSMSIQLDRLRRGIDIVVGTPGRVIDHLNRGTLKLEDVQFVVLDEADEMLNMGFLEDVEMILEKVGANRRMLLFSATMPDRILKLAKRYMGDYKLISVKKEQLATPLTDQIYFEVKQSDKFDALCRIIDVEKEFYGLVFCRTKNDTGELAQKLDERGYGAEALHGDVSQAQREKILKKFKDKKIHILTATDVAARGIHVTDLTHVINYSLPQDPESYVHRIGRTGRAGKEGTAITFITPSEFRRLAYFKKAANADIRKGTLPGMKEVMETRVSKIKEEVEEIIGKKDLKEYKKLASDILKDHDAEEAVAALLQYTFNVELDQKQVERDFASGGRSERGERSDRGSRDRDREDNYVDQKGKTRLFVAIGKKDDITPKKLIEFIQQETDLKDQVFGDIDIFDSFSFVNVPFEEAEIILNAFTEKFGKSNQMIQKAKAKDGAKRSGGGERSERRGPRAGGAGRSGGAGRGGSGKPRGDRSSGSGFTNKRSPSGRKRKK